VGDIRAVLRDHLTVMVESPDVDLLETGLVDSIGLVELILQLEDRFGVSLPMDILEIDDFRSINRIADLITRLSTVPLERVVGGRSKASEGMRLALPKRTEVGGSGSGPPARTPAAMRLQILAH
jgi:D-alanine--poly(phosphoribitol) ligase subunit 2